MGIIHESGKGGDKLEVISHDNGLAYAVNFGEVGSPMMNLFLQGNCALKIRCDFESEEFRSPSKSSRQIWLEILEPYLP